MSTTDDSADQALRDVLTEITDPREGECLFCYAYRMLEFGCRSGGLPWVRRWRDLRAPRATGLERRLAARGACCCECEIFLNGWRPARLVVDAHGDLAYPDVMPACAGVRRGSTQPCRLWVPKRRGGFDF